MPENGSVRKIENPQLIVGDERKQRVFLEQDFIALLMIALAIFNSPVEKLTPLKFDAIFYFDRYLLVALDKIFSSPRETAGLRSANGFCFCLYSLGIPTSRSQFLVVWLMEQE
jgi:hypothetical protein